MNINEIDNMGVRQLRQELKKRGLSPSGSKAELIVRMKQAVSGITGVVSMSGIEPNGIYNGTQITMGATGTTNFYDEEDMDDDWEDFKLNKHKPIYHRSILLSHFDKKVPLPPPSKKRKEASEMESLEYTYETIDDEDIRYEPVCHEKVKTMGELLHKIGRSKKEIRRTIEDLKSRDIPKDRESPEKAFLRYAQFELDAFEMELEHEQEELELRDELEELRSIVNEKDQEVSLLRQTLWEKEKLITAVGLAESIPQDLLLSWIKHEKFSKTELPNVTNTSAMVSV